MDRCSKCFGVYKQAAGGLNLYNEEGAVAENMCFQHLMFMYPAKDNCDAYECGLFYTLFSRKTCAFKGKCFKGMRVKKGRLTILVSGSTGWL
jgi:hypothetical protein